MYHEIIQSITCKKQNVHKLRQRNVRMQIQAENSCFNNLLLPSKHRKSEKYLIFRPLERVFFQREIIKYAFYCKHSWTVNE